MVFPGLMEPDWAELLVDGVISSTLSAGMVTAPACATGSWSSHQMTSTGMGRSWQMPAGGVPTTGSKVTSTRTRSRTTSSVLVQLHGERLGGSDRLWHDIVGVNSVNRIWALMSTGSAPGLGHYIARTPAGAVRAEHVRVDGIHAVKGGSGPAVGPPAGISSGAPTRGVGSIGRQPGRRPVRG